MATATIPSSRIDRALWTQIPIGLGKHERVNISWRWYDVLDRISGRSVLAQAIRYALNHWPGLILFLEDGRVELDTNTVERAIRPVALGRKNALFAGADSGGRHWAIIATLIQTAKLNDVDPLAWLTNVLERIVSGPTKRNELHTLLPWVWKVDNPAAVNTR
jgi:transposase